MVMSSSVRSGLPGRSQDVAGALLAAGRLADADADAAEVVGADVGLDRGEALVAGEPAGELHLDAARSAGRARRARRRGDRASRSWRRSSQPAAMPDSL